MAYIWHVTLDTGDTRRSHRHEVDPGVIAIMVPWIDQDETILTAVGGYRMVIPYRTNHCMAATVFSPANQPLVSVYVATKSRCAARMWKQAVDVIDGSFESMAPRKNDLLQPQTPWCAVRLWAPLRDHQSAQKWLGDFERCLAWAFIESRKNEPEEA